MPCTGGQEIREMRTSCRFRIITFRHQTIKIFRQWIVACTSVGDKDIPRWTTTRNKRRRRIISVHSPPAWPVYGRDACPGNRKKLHHFPLPGASSTGRCVYPAYQRKARMQKCQDFLLPSLHQFVGRRGTEKGLNKELSRP